MSYDINKMPETAEEFEQLVDYYFSLGQQKHKAALEAAKAQAEAEYAKLPEDKRPTLAEYVATATGIIPPAQTRQELEAEYACYKPNQAQINVEPQLTPEQELARKIAAIDYDTSQAILAGFNYTINNQTLHFNYDSFDQQNFADTANACLLAKSGIEGLPQSVTWNAYDQAGNLVRLNLTGEKFLELYTAGALAHKAACMEQGGQKKAALEV